MTAIGFFHPDFGYWEATEAPSAELRNSYPEGTVDVPVKPGPGWAWDGQVWTAGPEVIETLRAEAKARVLNWAATFGRQFTAGYTAEEVAAWSAKAAAARAELAGTPQPMIAAEAEVTGEIPAALAATILARAEVYETIVARITGLRRATMAAIDAATTAAEVDEALADALARAQAMIAALAAGAMPAPASAGGD